MFFDNEPETQEDQDAYAKGRTQALQEAPRILERVRDRGVSTGAALLLPRKGETAAPGIFARLAATPEFQLYRQAQGSVEFWTRRKDWFNVGYWTTIEGYAMEEYKAQYPLFWRKARMFFGYEEIDWTSRRQALRGIAESLA